MAETFEFQAPPPSRVRYGVLAFLCAAAAITYVQRQCLGVIEKEVRDGFEISMTQSAWLNGGFFLTYALLQVPCGRLGQIWGMRVALPLYAFISSAATVLLAATTGFTTFLSARMTMGLGQAGVFPCTTATLKRWFPPTHLAVSCGWVTTIMQVGGIGAPLLTSQLTPELGWRWTVALFAVPGLIWSVWFYVWFRDRPSEHPAVTPGELELLGAGPSDAANAKEAEPVEAIPWGLLLSSPALAFLCAAQFFRGAGYSFYSNWFTTYLRDGKHVGDLQQAGFLTTMPVVATALGSLAGGWLSDHALRVTNSRRISRQFLSAGSQLCCALIVLAAYPIQDPSLAVAIISAGSFCAAVAGPIAYAVTIESGGRHVTTVFGLMNMWGNLGAFAFPLAVPSIVGQGSSTNWNLVLILFAGIYLAAAICWLLFNADRRILDDENAPERIETP